MILGKKLSKQQLWSLKDHWMNSPTVSSNHRADCTALVALVTKHMSQWHESPSLWNLKFRLLSLEASMTAWILRRLKMWPSGVSLALKSPWDRVAVCQHHADEPASGIWHNDCAPSIEAEERAHLHVQWIMPTVPKGSLLYSTGAKVFLGQKRAYIDLEHMTKEEWWG